MSNEVELAFENDSDVFVYVSKKSQSNCCTSNAETFNHGSEFKGAASYNNDGGFGNKGVSAFNSGFGGPAPFNYNDSGNKGVSAFNSGFGGSAPFNYDSGNKGVSAFNNNSGFGGSAPFKYDGGFKGAASYNYNGGC